MLIIASGRKTSRTTQLIEMSAEAEQQGKVNYIIVANPEQAYSVAKKAKELNLNIGFPITYDEFLNHKYFGKNIDHFLIDNADHLLQKLTSVPIKAIVVEKSLGEEDA